MYKVIYEQFKDLEDNHIYKRGDLFPFDSRKVAKKRLTELMGNGNKLGTPLIEEIAEEVHEKEPEPVRQEEAETHDTE